jgi:hypothetical protein
MDHPPLHEIARYVVLYRSRNIKPYHWDGVGDSYRRATVELVRTRHRLLRAAHSIGSAVRAVVPAADELAVGAVAYVLLDDGQPPEVVRRFVGIVDETLPDGDPRTAMRVALAASSPNVRPQWTMGIMLKTWGLWVTGSTCRVVTWREDQPIPRVAGWPSFSIPTPQ